LVYGYPDQGYGRYGNGKKIINLKHLKGYKSGAAYMDNGKEVPLLRLRSKEFSGVVLQYMKNM